MRYMDAYPGVGACLRHYSTYSHYLYVIASCTSLALVNRTASQSEGSDVFPFFAQYTCWFLALSKSFFRTLRFPRLHTMWTAVNPRCNGEMSSSHALQSVYSYKCTLFFRATVASFLRRTSTISSRSSSQTIIKGEWHWYFFCTYNNYTCI